MSREILLQAEVPGTPEQVWDAVATGPGISAWFVPATVEGREGGEITLDFGSEMHERGTVTAYDRPSRFAYEAGTEDTVLVHEWAIERRDEELCTVRLRNSGFGEGEEWDDQYFGMEAGWRLFLENLRLYRTHFADLRCASVVVNAVATGGQETVFAGYLEELGIRSDEEQVSTSAGPALAGRVAGRFPGMLTILTETPHPGIVFLASEGRGDRQFVSFYGYFFGDGADEAAARVRAEWEPWLHARYSPFVM